MPPKRKRKGAKKAAAPHAKKQKTVPQERKEPSPLLRLPAELRNKIYELALVKEQRIVVTSKLRYPALISTCHQIHGEAIGLWFSGNHFEVPVIDCDSTLYQKYVMWNRMCHSASDLRNRGRMIQCDIRTAGKIKWGNLEVWTRAVWGRTLSALQRTALDIKHDAIIIGALEIAEQNRDRPWRDCQLALNTLRKTVEVLCDVQIP